jgi:hypothetical protein
VKVYRFYILYNLRVSVFWELSLSYCAFLLVLPCILD